MNNEDEVSRQAKENLDKWMEFLGKVDKAAQQAGITMEQGLNFLDYLYVCNNAEEGGSTNE